MSPHTTAITSHDHFSRANVTDVEVWLRGLEIQAVRDFFLVGVPTLSVTDYTALTVE